MVSRPLLCAMFACGVVLSAYAAEQAKEERQGGESCGGHTEADDQQFHAYQLVTEFTAPDRLRNVRGRGVAFDGEVFAVDRDGDAGAVVRGDGVDSEFSPVLAKTSKSCPLNKAVLGNAALYPVGKITPDAKNAVQRSAINGEALSIADGSGNNGDKLGSGHRDLLLSWECGEIKKATDAPQLSKLPGPHGHPDVCRQNLPTGQSGFVVSPSAKPCLGSKRQAADYRLTELGSPERHETDILSRQDSRGAGFALRRWRGRMPKSRR